MSETETVRVELQRARIGLLDAGLPVPELRGKLLRPTFAWAFVPTRERSSLPRAFWFGALAVQMAHEASLLHDDILDSADRRRGRPTLAARRGVGAALVQGDHVLTASYRAAARTGSPRFLELFVETLERTVAGEKRQAAAAGRPMEPAEYEAAIRAKSGQLVGCATALHACLAADGVVPARPAEAADGAGGSGLDRLRRVVAAREAGLRLGALYQRIDDLLDYCPDAPTGKPALRDWHQRKWSWVLDEAGVERFDLPPDELRRRLFVAPDGDSDPVARCMDRIETECRTLAAEHARRDPDDVVLQRLLDDWTTTARTAVRRQRAAVREAPCPAEILAPVLEAGLRTRAAALGGPESWPAYFGRHSRSFRFAARLFPPDQRERVAGIYAFCRMTDDLADEASALPPELRRARLRVWRRMARRAYDGAQTGVAVLDHVVGRARADGVPFHYVADLVEGAVSDQEDVRFRTLDDLRRYTYRVASVVGGWLTESLGIHDPAILARAYDLGHAMQLTNIVRDVGEDWRNGRLYLPLDLLERHGVSRNDVDRVARKGGPVPDGYVAALEELMEAADAHYARALEAVPALPAGTRHAVAVAARVYRGIHDEVRRNGYDNGTRRAFTGGLRKVWLGIRALAELHRGRRKLHGTSIGSLTPTRTVLE